MTRARLHLLWLVAGLTVTIAVLGGPMGATLPVPRHRAAVADLVARPDVAVMTGLRVAAIAAAVYLEVVVVVGVGLRVLRAGRSCRPLDALTWRPVRALVEQAAGTALLVGVLASAPAAMAAPAQAASATMCAAPALHEPVPGRATLRRLPACPRRDTGPTRAALIHLDDRPPSDVGPASGSATPTPNEYAVQRGDSLWSIAEGHSTRLQRDAADVWRQLLELNHDRLVDPDQPDLLFAGQRVVLPAV